MKRTYVAYVVINVNDTFKISRTAWSERFVPTIKLEFVDKTEADNLCSYLNGAFNAGNDFRISKIKEVLDIHSDTN